ncbi:hypothetical protein [Halopiger goleimassiliensis]|uniref:hypothetical protein n=1 Tax=Halopiger goleimassiliensis TaxID=1293048 RepID=UPI0006782640|nr:hypothetical protein [Halopiger goleimassiliensis]
MGLERFAKVNVVLVPILLALAYFYYESIPLLLWYVGVAYVTFAAIIVLTWGLSKLSLATESS